ncbi:MAG: bifunctional SulP family inorganic anion transporter/carbonic anhydrase [Bdellovibrionia bacterium]
MESNVEALFLKKKIERNKRTPKFNLGIPFLLPEWKKLLSPQYLKEDFVAGTLVACVAIPLSLAIALASGVDPTVGLVSAIVGSIVCALFGGTPCAVSGPAVAMAVLVASIVQDFGLGGLFFVGVGCGILQLFTGIFRFGQLDKAIPLPVISGFTAGIGAIIFIGQLPRALGLPAPDQSHVIDVVTHILDFIHKTHLPALGLTLSTLLLVFGLPKLFPKKVPVYVIAVLVPTILSQFLGLQVETVGNIPGSLSIPKFPVFPTSGFVKLFSATFVVYAIASLESLLSSSAVDKLSSGKKHDPNQELIGQGLGNIVSAMCGGIPVTGVIIRSALNIQAGAKTRRSALIHAGIIVLTIYFLAPWMSRIPVSVLAGILLAVTLRMMNPSEILSLFRTSKSDSSIYLITFLTIVFVDLLVGIQAGVIAALLIAAIRIGLPQVLVHSYNDQGPVEVSIKGAVTFMASSKIGQVKSKILQLDTTHGVVLDLSDVKVMDITGATLLYELFEYLEKRKVRFALRGVSARNREMFSTLSNELKLDKLFANNETDVLSLIGESDGSSKLDRISYGVQKFKRESRDDYLSLFKDLEFNQTPHTLFITCSDSRINPNLITSTDPGELFVVRNVGNIIPPSGKDNTPAEGAAIEFAVGILGVKEIIVCGHSSCGAMKAVIEGNIFDKTNTDLYPNISMWLQQTASLKKKVSSDISLKQLTEENARLQIDNLRTYSLVQQKLASNELKISIWYYDIGQAEIEKWNEDSQQFLVYGEDLSV